MKFIKIKGKIKQRLKLVLPLTALALLAVFGIIGQSKVKAAGRKIPIYSVKGRIRRLHSVLMLHGVTRTHRFYLKHLINMMSK